MGQTEREIALRKEALQKSTEAVDKLNDNKEAKAKLLKLFQEWESEDSAESKKEESKKNLDQ